MLIKLKLFFLVAIIFNLGSYHHSYGETSEQVLSESTRQWLNNLKDPIFIGSSDICPHFKFDIPNCRPSDPSVQLGNKLLFYQINNKAENLTYELLKPFYQSSLGEFYICSLVGENSENFRFLTGLNPRYKNSLLKNCSPQSSSQQKIEPTDKISSLPIEIVYIISPHQEHIKSDPLHSITFPTNLMIVIASVDEIISGLTTLSLIHEMSVFVDSKNFIDFAWSLQLQFQELLTSKNRTADSLFILSQKELFELLHNPSWLKAIQHPLIQQAFVAIRAYKVEKTVVDHTNSNFFDQIYLSEELETNNRTKCHETLRIVLDLLEPTKSIFLEVFGPNYFLIHPGDILRTSLFNTQIDYFMHTKTEALNVLFNANFSTEPHRSLCEFLSEPYWSRHGIRGASGPRPRIGTWQIH